MMLFLLVLYYYLLDSDWFNPAQSNQISLGHETNAMDQSMKFEWN